MCCSNCNCKDCQACREEDDEEPLSEAPESIDYDYQNDPSYQGVAGPTAPAPTYKVNPVRVTSFPPPKAPPPDAKMHALIEESFRSVWKDYSDLECVNMLALTSIMIQRIACITPQQYALVSEQIHDFLRGKAQDPNSGFGIYRGRGGGFRRIVLDTETTLDASSASATINDYTCLACGNDRCSKTEKSCWKCGEPIQ